jgi:hypothetical protein
MKSPSWSPTAHDPDVMREKSEKPPVTKPGREPHIAPP